MKSEDVGFLMEYMHGFSYKWRYIGMSLRFQPGELENLRHSFPEEPTMYFLMEILSQWTQWPTTAHPHVPTLEKLAVLCVVAWWGWVLLPTNYMTFGPSSHHKVIEGTVELNNKMITFSGVLCGIFLQPSTQADAVSWTIQL